MVYRFDQFPLSPLSLKAIKDAEFETMTVVQEATLPIILQGELFFMSLVYKAKRKNTMIKKCRDNI